MAVDPINLEPEGAVASVIIQLVTKAMIEAMRSDASRIAVSAFLEGHGRKTDERWKLHITGMKFDENEQSLKITGLRLDPA